MRWGITVPGMAVLVLLLCGCGGGGGGQSGPTVTTQGIDYEGVGTLAFSFTWPVADPQVTRLVITVDDGLQSQTLETVRDSGSTTTSVTFPTVAAGHPEFTAAAYATGASTPVGITKGAVRVHAGQLTTQPLGIGEPVDTVTAFPLLQPAEIGKTYHLRVMAFSSTRALLLLPPGSITLRSLTPELAQVGTDGGVTVLSGGTVHIAATIPGADFYGVARLYAVSPISGARGIIAFNTIADDYEDFNSDIYLVNADGTHLRRLTRNHAADVAPALNRAGTQVAFLSSRGSSDPYAYRLYLMRTDGTGLHPFIDSTAYRAQFLDDGRLLYWTSAGVYTANPDGSNRRPFVLPTLEIPIEWYKVSSDGQHIAVYSSTNQTSSGDVYFVNVDGTGLQRLTPPGLLDHHQENALLSMCFSQDGNRLAMSAGHYGSGGSLYLVNIDGSNFIETPRTSMGSPVLACFSPDGQFVMQTTNMNGQAPFVGGGDTYTIGVSSVDGTTSQEVLGMAQAGSWVP